MKAKRFTYHWAIVIACFILMASSVGITQNCFNLFSIEIMNELKFTASQVQVMNTIATLMTMVSALVVGTVFNKFSMRLAMPVYAICLTGGFFLYSTVNSLAQLYILSALVGFGRGGVAVVPCGLLMNNWFKEKRGFATGIALAGSTAGGFVFVRIANAIIASMDWRRAYMVLGVMAAVLIIPTVIFVIREKPEDKGLRPYGATDEDTASAVKAEFTGISRKKFLKTSAFWMLGITFFLISAINMGLQNNVSIYLTMQKGQTRELAADVASILLLSQVVGKILLGSIYDKKGVKFGSAYGCVVRTPQRLRNGGRQIWLGLRLCCVPALHRHDNAGGEQGVCDHIRRDRRSGAVYDHMHASAPHKPGGRAQRVLQHLRTPQRLRNGGRGPGSCDSGLYLRPHRVL